MDLFMQAHFVRRSTDCAPMKLQSMLIENVDIQHQLTETRLDIC